MAEDEWLAKQFETHRAHLRAVAFRMLGSRSEAEDAVQEAWLRLSRTPPDGVDNLSGWLTTVVARVCLDLLRTRRLRAEESLGDELPDAGEVAEATAQDLERERLLADSIGPALLVILETLAPAERLAFVLHDMFAMPFEEIAPIVGRSAAAVRQLASRARRRVQGATTVADTDSARKRQAVEAFLTASRNGDFDALVAVLDPEVVVRADAEAARAGAAPEVRGAVAVANTFKGRAQAARLALVDGSAGAVWSPGGQPRVVFEFTVANGKIVALALRGNPAHLAAVDLVVLEP
jgi:RNA polymerase sigma-70 factor (ECF subfamily)